MAVSNVLGSNVFNIFLGLGPWLIYTAVWWTLYTSIQMQDSLALSSRSSSFSCTFSCCLASCSSPVEALPKGGHVLILLDLLFIAWSLLTCTRSAVRGARP